MLAMVASKLWPLYQLNVKNVFLHGDLKEEIYMRIPPSYETLSKTDVAQLSRSLYGLKQGPRASFEKFRSGLLQLDFSQSPYDPSLFLHHTTKGIIILLIYVDDVIIIGTYGNMIRKLQASLQDSFHVKDLGPLPYFLGLEIHQYPKGIFLH